MRVRYFYLLLIISWLVPLLSFSQDSWKTRYYYSTSSPSELNTNSLERLDSLFKHYYTTKEQSELKNYSRKEYREFVYRVNYFIENINSSGRVFYNNDISDYLNSLKDFLLSDMDEKDRVKVLLTNYPSFNAFTNDFGFIYINIATLTYVHSEEELLALLAHELSHFLLKHTHSFESYSKELAKKEFSKDEYEMIQMHTYSKSKEYEADVEAFKLLASKGIDLKKALRLYVKLKYHIDPCFAYQKQLPYFGIEDKFVRNHIKNCKQNHQFLYERINPFDTDSSFTHPEIDNRILRLDSFILVLDNYIVTYNANKVRFYDAQNEAKNLLVKSYIEYGWYYKALDLVLKLRNSDPDNKEYIIDFAKILTLITQSKYDASPYSQILNDEGNVYLDSAYLFFKEHVLSFNALEFNIISLFAIKEMRKKYDITYLDRSYKFLYDFLFRNNKQLFESVNSELNYKDPLSLKKSIIDPYDLHDPKKKSEVVLLEKEIEDEESIYIPTNTYSSFKKLLVYYISNFPIDTIESEFIESSRPDLDKFFDLLSSENGSTSFDSWETSIFKKPIHQKSTDFDVEAKSALVQTRSLYFKGKKRPEFKIIESLKVEKRIEMVLTSNNGYHWQYSNISSKSRTISDAYMHYCLVQWITDQILREGFSYSSVDEQIERFRNETGIRYLIVNLNLVQEKSFLSLKSYETLSYNIYFDLETGGIAYISIIGSKHRPNKALLGQLLYLSEYYKNK